ncbi:AMP-binding protein [Methylocella sp. CPCC 101449]|uniref:AMP-binding protein n=1 Tax=Methylocella sp. CPCC 101449 TaxID=2987531 RepID=UPI00289035CF|nr:AMP-binding protein [Methylocella sp. CPCC 101449]MDT2023640.1 AMP-binding protein [Methylocella sp. CPCC 101449]
MDAKTALKPWLAHYPAGVPADIDATSLGTLVDVFNESVTKFGDHPALESFGKRINYSQFGELAQALGSGLQRMGLKKGDRVAIMMPNVMAYAPIMFGILAGGFTVVNVNPLYTPRELSHQLNDAGVRILFVLENFCHTVEAALPDLKTVERAVIVAPGDLLGLKGAIVNFVSRYVKKGVPRYALPATIRFGRFLAFGREKPLAKVDLSVDDVAFLQYTGGTTGVAKGATLLHSNIVANVLQCEAWTRPFIGDTAHYSVVTALPLYHILSLTGCCVFTCRIGGLQILVANPRDISGLVKTLQTSKPNELVLVNTLYNALAQHRDISKVDFSNLRVCIAGGMATQAPVAQRWKEISGKPIVEGYGLSETSPVVCLNRLDIEEFTGMIGYPVPSTDVSIRSPDGDPMPIGEAGELCVKGPQVMAGYWQRPDETAKVMTADGYLRTGDVGILDAQGMIKIVDRMKDMIVMSGLKVFPNEVEEVLASHPKVLEAAVIGVPDPHSGEAVAAFVVPKDPSLKPEELRAFAREKLTAYKVPKTVEFRETLPKTNVGKILRRELRDDVLGKPPKAA